MKNGRRERGRRNKKEDMQGRLKERMRENKGMLQYSE
jgi:hypothetical protein